MPLYYVQKFSYAGPGESLCYGEMGSRDHDVSNQFSVDLTKYLTAKGSKNILAGNFRSNQPVPANGKEFNWNGTNWIKN